MSNSFKDYLGTVADAIATTDTEALLALTDVLETAYLNGKTIYTFGNGACAALAGHMACDLGKGASLDLDLGPDVLAGRRVRIVSLNDCVPLVTALANDLSYEDVFLEQLKNLLVPGDVAFGLSGSGGSPNVLRALRYARRAGGVTVSMTGAQEKAGLIAELSDVCVRAPLKMMEQIEDAHVVYFHAIAKAMQARIRAAAALPERA